MLYWLSALVSVGWLSWKADPLATLILFALVGAGLIAANLCMRVGQRQDEISITSAISAASLLDDLTGLPNRRLFISELRAALEKPIKPNEFTAVFFIDLDRFKSINDSLGHSVGDRLLVAVTSRLQSCLPPGWRMARLGGDEFTIFAAAVKGRNEVIAQGEILMEQFTTPIEINGQELWSNASIGIVMAAMPRPSADDLLRMADVALYNAKSQGRGQFVLFEPNLPTPSSRSLSIGGDLRLALQRVRIGASFSADSEPFRLPNHRAGSPRSLAPPATRINPTQRLHRCRRRIG
jgi:diguanylate cyclase (GGDEF)-like protein